MAPTPFMLKNFLRKIYYKICNQLERTLYRHHSAIYRRDGEKMERLKVTAKGLHSLLPKDSRYSYSFLIPVDAHTKLKYLNELILACKNQSAADFEILAGAPKALKSKLNTDIEVLWGEGQKAEILNNLAAKAKGNFLIPLDSNDWIRPDFLLRTEQVLRSLPDPEQNVVFCNEYVIDEQNKTCYFQEIRKKELKFPYIFTDPIGNGVVIPKKLWNAVKGLNISVNEAWSFFDLTLRLNLAGAQFIPIPLFLYARRNKSVERNHEAPLESFRDYAAALQLNWDISHGFDKQFLRAIPKNAKTPAIHVIIPFKDQKELTLATLICIKKQVGVDLRITAIDNGSKDTTIGKTLTEHGIEVLTVHEPFNYSRLNNIAVKQSKIGASCEYLLFLNNDVELDSEAVLEMSRWASQPGIGLVGCRLHYPNNTLQHGGVSLNRSGPGHLMVWEHVERGMPWDKAFSSKQVAIVDAVTAACAMMRRDIFEDIGGFDEIWYPIAFSDTNLAQRLSEKNLSCLYTPYAFGIHHESISRKNENIEDFESSRWLSEMLKQRRGDLSGQENRL